MFVYLVPDSRTRLRFNDSTRSNRCGVRVVSVSVYSACDCNSKHLWGNDRREKERLWDPAYVALQWDPTFTHFERFILFWKAPIVIFIFNAIVAWTVTIMFSEYFIRQSPINQSPHQFDLPVSWEEMVITVYCKKNALKCPAMLTCTEKATCGADV
jgi:hypothetical protein